MGGDEVGDRLRPRPCRRSDWPTITSLPVPVLTVKPPEISKLTKMIKLSPLPAVIVALPIELLLAVASTMVSVTAMTLVPLPALITRLPPLSVRIVNVNDVVAVEDVDVDVLGVNTVARRGSGIQVVREG